MIQTEKILQSLFAWFLIALMIAGYYSEKQNKKFFSELPKAEQERLQTGFDEMRSLDQGDLVSYDGNWYELVEAPNLSGFLKLHGIYDKNLWHNHFIEHSWIGMQRLLDDHQFECVTMAKDGYSALATIHPGYGW